MDYLGNLHIIADSLEELTPFKSGRHKFALQRLNLLNYVYFCIIYIISSNRVGLKVIFLSLCSYLFEALFFFFLIFEIMLSLFPLAVDGIRVRKQL